MTIDAFHRLVCGLSNVNFGDFDMIGKYFGNSTEDAERLDGLNVTFLMLQVGKPCDSLCRTDLEVFLSGGLVLKTLLGYMLSFILIVISCTDFLVGLYRVIQEERSVLWEVIVSVTVREEVQINVCLILNDSRDRAV
jgi:hypothetical protein